MSDADSPDRERPELARLRQRSERRQQRMRRARADLLGASPWIAVGLLGALPAPREPSALALLVWLALWSPVAGWLAGASALRLLAAATIPATWMLAFVLLEARALPDGAPGISAPAGAAAAWSGLFAAGFGAGRWAAGRAAWRWRGAGLVAAAVALATAAPLGAGLLEASWPAGFCARALDLSPVVLVVESAGITDWMWHPSTYVSAGVDRFQRAPFDAALAGPLTLLVGWAIAILGTALCARNPSSART